MSLALPDEEVQQMARDYPIFKKAEDRIVRIWANLPKEQKKWLRSEQIDWIINLRDTEASALMEIGISRVEAYTIVTDNRSDYLLGLTGTTSQITQNPAQMSKFKTIIKKK
ncbi:MAG: hypothetical protein LBT38_07860 [Deltaproteobacteria bacterium]|nr:hypothetical protein [Deltaproteobacteria bacterium]